MNGNCGQNESHANTAQRRTFPFGGDRSVIGAADLTRDERFTGQRRVDTGNGNPRRELYHYGARAYLPGVGLFTQPDSVVPDPKNPQALNRYGYALNNPLGYVDPTGHFVMFVGGMRTENDDEENTNAWFNMIVAMGLDPNDKSAGEGWDHFNWGAPGNSDIGSLQEAAKAMGEQLTGARNIKLIGHSRGGALVMEFMAEVSEGLGEGYSWSKELRGAYTIDSPLDPAIQSVINPIAGNRYERIGPFPIRDRYANLPGKLEKRLGLTVDMANFDNPEDFPVTNHSPIPGMQYFGWQVKPDTEHGESWTWEYKDSAHGLLQRNPMVGVYIGWRNRGR